MVSVEDAIACQRAIPEREPVKGRKPKGASLEACPKGVIKRKDRKEGTRKERKGIDTLRPLRFILCVLYG